MSLNPNPFEDLPEPLIAEMRAVYAKDVDVPASVDGAILKEVRAGFARRNRFRLNLIRFGAVAAAALVAIAIIVPSMSRARRHSSSTPVASKMLMIEPARAEDVDHNGKVDILDAFVVAKLIDAREKLDEAYDVNGDGQIDQADVDRIAMTAVSSSGREVQ